jgi:hypothetical protein
MDGRDQRSTVNLGLGTWPQGWGLGSAPASLYDFELLLAWRSDLAGKRVFSSTSWEIEAVSIAVSWLRRTEGVPELIK